jgi:hypothetical protein
MGKVEYMRLLLNDYGKHVHFSGEMLAGIVSLKVTTRFKINCVKLTVKGEGNTYW